MYRFYFFFNFIFLTSFFYGQNGNESIRIINKISDTASKELDKIAEVLNNNKNINIEISSYTDSRGSREYNLELTKSIAKSSADYLINLGVDKIRIIAKGFGESKMINKCIDGIRCSEAAHEKNNRIEFSFVSIQNIESSDPELKLRKKDVKKEIIHKKEEKSLIAKKKVIFNSDEIKGFKIYPNPLENEVLHITSLKNNSKIIQIYNILGKQIISTNLRGTKLNLSSLQAGVYILKAYENGRTTTRKLVVK